MPHRKDNKDLSKKSFFLISFSDLYKDLKKERKKIVLTFLILSSLCFTYSLIKPIRYTAVGLFKTAAPKPSVWIDLLTKGEAESDEDPRLLLNSYAVTSHVVKNLHLQGHIQCDQSEFFLNRIWQNLYLERCFAAMGNHEQPKSEILAKDILVPRHILNFVKPSSLTFTDLVYDDEIYTVLLIKFLDEENFSVSNSKKQIVGTGKLNEPFYFTKGHFTLTGKPQERFGKIHLIPLKNAAYSLAKSLNIKKVKANPALLQISYTSHNLALAVNIVNQIMSCYHSQVEKHTREKIENQMVFLKQRQKDAFRELEIIMQDYRTARKENTTMGGFLQLENEASFMMDQKAKISRDLAEIKMNIMRIAPLVFLDGPMTIEAILEKAKNIEKSHWQHLALDNMKNLFCEYLKSLDLLELQKNHYEHCLEKLADPKHELSSVVKTLEEPSLEILTKEIQTLNAHLFDKKNWSQREKEIIQEELNTKKNLLCKELEHLKAARVTQIAVFIQKLGNMHKALLLLLCDEYEKINSALLELTEKELAYPEKWIKEETISLNAKMTTAMIEQISKVMEGKNIASHIASAESYPFEKAQYPILPNPPKILQKTTLAGCLGILAFFLGLFAKHLQIGPTASFQNLKGMQLPVIGEALFSLPKHYAKCESLDQNCLKLLSYHLASYSCILLSCQKAISLWKVFFELIAQRKEKIAIIHFQEGNIEGFDNFSYATDSLFREEHLTSKHFAVFLDDIKMRYDKVFLIHVGLIDGINAKTLQKHATCTVFFLTNELLSQLPNDNASFVTERMPKKKEKEVYLQEFRPLIDALQQRVISSSSLYFKKIFAKKQ